MRRRQFWQTAVVVPIAGFCALRGTHFAGASSVRLTGDDQISTTYEIPISSPSTGVSIPNVLLVKSAHVDSLSPDGTHADAPRGSLYLSMKWSSRPASRTYGDPLWGAFFSGITPLPASSLAYISGSQSYPASRVNPISQGANTDAETDDGLVNATYFFVVPESNRRGTVVISPTHSIGTQYTGFVGGDPTSLTIGGPTRIPISFPAKLTRTETASPSTPQGGSTSAFGIRDLLQVLFVVGVVAVMVWLLRKPRRGVESTVGPTAVPSPPVLPPPPILESDVVVDEVIHDVTPTDLKEEPGEQVSEVVDSPKRELFDDVKLRVQVLGALRFEPALPGLSEPARSLLCYLALHRDRPLTSGEIQTALWPMSTTTKDVSPRTFQNYVSEARRAVGRAVFPESRSVGYRLEQVSVDFEEFLELERRAALAGEPEATALRQQALALVREHPLATETAPYFEWVRAEGFETTFIRSVSDLAVRTGLDLINRHDLEFAEGRDRTPFIGPPLVRVAKHFLRAICLRIRLV